jgi:hypothetical protein
MAKASTLRASESRVLLAGGPVFLWSSCRLELDLLVEIFLWHCSGVQQALSRGVDPCAKASTLKGHREWGFTARWPPALADHLLISFKRLKNRGGGKKLLHGRARVG